MKAKEIRQKFLDFFVEKGHSVEPSASLVPVDDPSLLWINSGVATLKPYFDGRIVPENRRIVNAQKAIRTNDIENVGYTARHHTFFEMLGNFSIGDYFKEEAILWAWEFLTSPKWLNLDPERLSVTIHPEDEESYQIWTQKVGIPAERVVKLKDNFWDIGEGPCGPNSEIFYDRGESWGDPNDPECYPGGENERYLEIWNLVFSQYNHNPDGSYTPLPNKNIDTGMGLERIASVMQDVPTNYDTDLFQPIIQAICKEAKVTYGEKKETDIALKVIADHLRTLVFAIGDGVLPGNEGRGYVLRRLLRRAVRYGRSLGIERPFLYSLTGIVGDLMKEFYPEPYEKKSFIERVIRGEEERFLETLSEGLHLLEGIIQKTIEKNNKEIKGVDAFQLYDTYGFPFELTEEIAREQGLSVDKEGFEKAMSQQRERARSARQAVDSMQVQGNVLQNLQVESRFIGYNKTAIQTRVVALLQQDEIVDQVKAGEKCLVILEETPFYAESGGQVADPGVIFSEKVRLRVEDVQKGPHGEHIHQVQVEEGMIQVGDTVEAAIELSHRLDIVKNHTATHLLHKALQEVLGDHVTQAGSLVAADRLRFDFTHIGPLSDEEIREVEREVNQQIWANKEVETMIKPFAEAKAMGAMALFGEKYGDTVRVVKIGDYSLELCGGTHVHSTGEIGLFKIVSESGIGSGTRRIEALTGAWAYRYLQHHFDLLSTLSNELKTTPEEAMERIQSLNERIRTLTRENESLRGKILQQEARSLISEVKEIQGIPVLVRKVEVPNAESLRQLVDDLRGRIKEGIIILGAANKDKVLLVAAVTSKYVKEGFHAGKLIKQIASYCGGGGGGRPDMAQAGGKEPEKLQKALEMATQLIQEQAIK